VSWNGWSNIGNYFFTFSTTDRTDGELGRDDKSGSTSRRSRSTNSDDLNGSPEFQSTLPKILLPPIHLVAETPKSFKSADPEAQSKWPRRMPFVKGGRSLLGDGDFQCGHVRGQLVT
jgi:hypothetical protein